MIESECLHLVTAGQSSQKSYIYHESWVKMVRIDCLNTYFRGEGWLLATVWGMGCILGRLLSSLFLPFARFSHHYAQLEAQGLQWIFLKTEVVQFFVGDDRCCPGQTEGTCPRFHNGSLPFGSCGGPTSTLAPVPGQHVERLLAIVTENPEARHLPECSNNE